MPSSQLRVLLSLLSWVASRTCSTRPWPHWVPWHGLWDCRRSWNLCWSLTGSSPTGVTHLCSRGMRSPLNSFQKRLVHWCVGYSGESQTARPFGITVFHCYSLIYSSGLLWEVIEAPYFGQCSGYWGWFAGVLKDQLQKGQVQHTAKKHLQHRWMHVRNGFEYLFIGNLK